MANPLKDTFDYVRECYTQWFRALRSPWLVAARLLVRDQESTPLGRATGFWFSAFFLSVIVSLPIYYIFGLKLENLSFQLCAVVAQYLTLLAFSAAFHYALRRYAVPSVFAETFTLYTVIAAAAGPVITLIALPALLRSLRITAAVKSQHLSFIGAVKATVGAMLQVDNSFSSLLVMAFEPLVTVLGLLIIATFVQLLAEHYGVPEPAVVHAIGFALGVICPVLLVAVVLLQQALLFAFMP